MRRQGTNTTIRKSGSTNEQYNQISIGFDPTSIQMKSKRWKWGKHQRQIPGFLLHLINKNLQNNGISIVETYLKVSSWEVRESLGIGDGKRDGGRWRWGKVGRERRWSEKKKLCLESNTPNSPRESNTPNSKRVNPRGFLAPRSFSYFFQPSGASIR